MLATEGYCVKCKAKRPIKGEQQVTMKNGRPAIKGSKALQKGKTKPKPKSKAKPKPKSKAKPKPKSKAKPRRR
jgi:hypothetical protein